MQLNLVAHFEKTGIGKMSFCKEQKKIGCFRNRPFGRGRRTLSPRSTLVGQDGSTVPKGTVFTAVLFSSFCKKQRKNRLLSQPTFWQGQKDSFSSLDARRSGRLYRAKGHGIHCRPILVLLQEANKKIGCFRNRPFLADPHFRNPNILPKRKNGYFSLDYRKQ